MDTPLTEPDRPERPEAPEPHGVMRRGRRVWRAAIAAATLSVLAACVIIVAMVSMRDRARARSTDAETVTAPLADAGGRDGTMTPTPYAKVAGAQTAPTVAPPTPPPLPAPTPLVAVVATVPDAANTEPTGAPSGDEPPAATRPALPPAVEIASPPPGMRDKRLWPFSSDSIWNLPIGSNAAYVPAGIGEASSLSTDEEYFVFPAPSDPLRPFFTNGIWGRGRCATSTYQYSINLPDAFQVGDATQRDTPNAVAAVLSADGRTLKQMNPVARCVEGGPLTAGWTAPDQDIYGPGMFGAHGGSGLSSIGGSIRMGELTGAEPIRHALKVNLWGHRWLSQAAGGYRWPAVTADSYFDDPNSPEAYAGPLPQLRMGALLAIPGDIDLRALGLQTLAAQKLAWTMQNYGAYVVDDTAWDSDSLDVEAGVDNEFANAFGYGIDATTGPWYDDIMRIFGLLAVVDNNGPSSIGGGGTPRQPLAPPIGN